MPSPEGRAPRGCSPRAEASGRDGASPGQVPPRPVRNGPLHWYASALPPQSFEYAKSTCPSGGPWAPSPVRAREFRSARNVSEAPNRPARAIDIRRRWGSLNSASSRFEADQRGISRFPLYAVGSVATQNKPGLPRCPRPAPHRGGPHMHSIPAPPSHPRGSPVPIAPFQIYDPFALRGPVGFASTILRLAPSCFPLLR